MKKRIIQFLILDILCIVMLFVWVKQPVLFANSSDFPSQADVTKLETHTRMLSETFVPRDYTHPENLNAAADYIQVEFEKTSGRVSEQPYMVDGVTYKNVILELGPRLVESDGLIVLGAHYDAFDVHPAADDNASGVAGLLELSRLLDGAELSKTVQFVAYTLEEPPFFRSQDMGSARHATSLAASSIPIDLMISLEMIGYFSDEPDSQRYPVGAMGWLYPTTGNFVGVIGRFNQGLLVRQVKRGMLAGSDLPVEAIAAPPNLVPGIDFSDHLNYWKYDYPAVMVTDTAFNRNFAYHTAEDTADRLDYDRMGKVVQGIYEVVLDQQ
ncbi:MAG: M28 family peptidase [Anaerolineae bacterium]